MILGLFPDYQMCLIKIFHLIITLITLFTYKNLLLIDKKYYFLKFVYMKIKTRVEILSFVNIL